MRFLEVAVFLSLSGAIHIAAATLAPSQTGGLGAGEDGKDQISLQAATPTLAAMVANWETPPEISQEPLLPAPSDQVPALPHTSPEAVFSPTAASLMPLPDAQAAPPTVESRLPAPPRPLALTTPQPLPAPSLTLNGEKAFAHRWAQHPQHHLGFRVILHIIQEDPLH